MMTVAELLEILQRLPASARVIVQGYESGFNDVTGAAPQPIVVNGGHRERDRLGPYVPAVQGGGDHESPSEIDAAADELAMLITSTRHNAAADPVLSQLRGTVQRFEGAIGPVWSGNDESGFNDETGQDLADHAARVLSVHAQASEVLEDPAIAMQWMLRPAVLLDSNRPLDALATQSGYDRVRDLLMRLEHGIGI
ncbi:antitoxin Xre/MbcA/ParS toxin-binding domain-containing protein [Paraburkholderia sp. BL10I2N1]|uniref:antitoxin Xre/MbcA/ParS toxin-binding domain-containing protein n=1 Tax=Paraburkholderia sp. BL10I2N1 TaxID=1938796 RepID=UPI0010D706D4|nr:antitoxin Xre/MbcA/ParS toxin-binding domain-containing protein [Paraburkholderia sp. BL10I2N1]TDN62430.1 putative toxin-antitoxin system antitoxin component (TIGR02293 family) [Paraburkholderia sp. BL10I2N1]